jgi:CHASE3 domain sensor protein
VQATTANQPILNVKETRSALLFFVLVMVLILLASFSGAAEQLHQMLDPRYRNEIETERSINKFVDQQIKEMKGHQAK